MTPTPSQATHEAAQRYFDIRKCYPDQADRQLAEIIQATVDAQVTKSIQELILKTFFPNDK